jgi:hypothetical protein
MKAERQPKSQNAIQVITDRSQSNMQARWCITERARCVFSRKYIPAIEAEIQLIKHVAL